MIEGVRLESIDLLSRALTERRLLPGSRSWS